MDNIANLTAAIDTKTAKGLSKGVLHGGAAPFGPLPISFEQLLDDSTMLLAAPEAALTPALGVESSKDESAESLVGAKLAAPSGATNGDAAPASMLQVWQAWLPTPATEPSTLDKMQSEGGQSVNLIDPQSPRREAQAPTEARALAREAIAQPTNPIADSNEEAFALPNGAGTAAPLPQEEQPAEKLEPVTGNGLHAALAPKLETRRAEMQANPTAVVQINAPLRSPEWSNAFSEQVVLLVRDGDQRAELRLNPAELGPIDVTLSVQDDRVQANFTIHHAVAVEAVQAALPKLEQMMTERGIQLDSVSVETNDRREEQSAPQSGGNNSAGGQGRRNGNAEPAQRVVKRVGLVDTFA